jgi:hypothetical protein
MVPTIVPHNVDYMAIAMEKRARVQGNMPSAILNVAPGTQDSSTVDDAEVSF